MVAQVHPHPPSVPPRVPPRARHFLVAGAASAGLAGLVIGRLTIGLNAHLDDGDRVLLLLTFLVGYGVLGLLAGGAAVFGLTLAARLGAGEAVCRAVGNGLLLLAAAGPMAYLALLPDVGLLPPAILTEILFSWPAWTVAAAAAGVLLAAVLAGAWATRLRRRPTPWALGAAWALTAVLVVTAALRNGSDEVREDVEVDVEATVSDTPVVVLCIDGADLDDVVLPMVEAGELPAFASLMRDGVWGPLETLEPTLSPIIWTTLATGRTPEEHGVFHFFNFKLPGLDQAVLRFPLHTGFNFRLFPLLEKLPLLPQMRRPYTSNMRRVPALWNIVSRFAPVGVYRWLTTWPAEPVDGFNLAGDVVVSELGGEITKLRGPSRTPGLLQPPDALEDFREPRPDRTPTSTLAAYAGDPVDRRDEKVRFIDSNVRDPSLSVLRYLRERFHPRLTMVNFYSVDGFQHHFSRQHVQGPGVPFANAVTERYRFTDARLGELLADLGDDVHVLVVSDHGFDFKHHHHTWSPAGLFAARGPAFRRGVRLDGEQRLSVYDVAPLVLRLLDLPLPEDMPGTRSGRYEAALGESFRQAHPEHLIPTYGRFEASQVPLENPEDERIRETLRDLGYIQ